MNVGFVKITRGKDPENKSTFGKVEVLDGNLKVVWTGSSMERPWKDNKNDESCIPAGLYRLKKRVSPIVDKTSGGEFKEGWEVTDVQGRTFIMFHVGNYVRNSNGCVLIGTKIAVHDTEGFMVTSSKSAFKEFMDVIEKLNVDNLYLTVA